MARIKEIVLVDKSLNKHGEIKGKNKKETKMLRKSCVHHKYNKKGNIRSVTFPVNNPDTEFMERYGESKFFVCRRCGKMIRLHTYNKKEVKEILAPVYDCLETEKFIAAATNAGQGVVSYLVGTQIQLDKLPKVAGKLDKIASKKSKLASKKKSRDQYKSSQYGSWSRK
jgi:hypothetical protein